MTRSGWWGMMALGLTVLTAACGSETPDAGERPTPIRRIPIVENEFTPVELEATVDTLIAEINKSSFEPMQMALVLKSAAGFWTSVITAANRAMGELEVTGTVIGPLVPQDDVEVAEQLLNEQIEQTVSDGAEGLGIAPLNDDQAAVVDEAIAKGVHVVTLDTDVATSKRAIHVGTLDRSAGVTAGDTLLAMLPTAPGTVIIHGNADEAWSGGIDRTQGAQEVFEAAGYEVLVRQSSWNPDGEAEDVEGMTAELETADPPVVGMLGLFNISYRCAMAAEAAGKTDIPIVAFDFDPKTVDYMRKGRIKATHIQRQYYQGYLVPYILYGIKSIGLDATKEILAPQMVDDSRVNTGLDVVPGDKIDAYNDFLYSIDANQ
ncbi:sugar ABC transporter substrate-binding protein [Sorangium sp. So ce1182]|uniref:sugar ABC transporter substrate-binding protein n=1 Tax=Sorangium sp. So ce1182 TaxID=3133334 RepID=UPI003F5F464E